MFKLFLALLFCIGLTNCVVYEEPPPMYPHYVYYDGAYGYWNGGIFVRGYYPHYHYYYRGGGHYYRGGGRHR